MTICEGWHLDQAASFLQKLMYCSRVTSSENNLPLQILKHSSLTAVEDLFTVTSFRTGWYDKCFKWFPQIQLKMQLLMTSALSKLFNHFMASIFST